MVLLGIGFNSVKRALKRSAGTMAAMSVPFIPQPRHPQACIFVYHRLANIGFVDPSVDDWNVAPHVFSRQIEILSRFAEFVALHDLRERFRDSSRPEKPLVCLTFDDGYSSVFRHALPVLRRFQIPATVFVVTAYIGHRSPMPFDGWSKKRTQPISEDVWRPMDWRELEACVDSGVITLGGHSHEHSDGRSCSVQHLQDEAGRSREILQSRFGPQHAQIYSYPYGSTRLGHVNQDYVQAVKDAGYTMAVCTDLGLAGPHSHPFLLPRVEAHEIDSDGALRAKALGALFPYRMTDSLRRAVRN